MKIKEKWYYFFILGMMLGGISFIVIYGFETLNVQNDLWLKSTERDLYAHYLGWKYFRKSSWYFPIGMMDSILYPDLVSIIYTDSIPLFAIIFKVLSPILPETFQYFGIWGLMCFMLQGGVAALIIKKIVKTNFILIIFTELFVLSPSVLHRMYYHTELAAHFLILLAFLIWINEDKINSFRKRVLLWSALFALTASIHIYFIPMIGIIMFCSIIELMVREKRYIINFLSMVIPCIVGLGILGVLGAFVSNRSLSKEGGLGFYSANINSLFNSQGWGGKILEFPLATTGQHEGYAYLGMGVIIFLLICIVQYIWDIWNKKKSINIFWTICLGISFFVALSPSISINSRILFTIPLPQFILTILEMFRATGRFLWIDVYLILIFIVYIVSKLEFNRKYIYLLLSMCMLIQLYDLLPIIRLRYHVAEETYVAKDNNNYQYMNSLQSPIWTELAKKYKHIEFLKIETTVHANYIDSFSLADLAIENNMTISNFPIARPNVELREEKNEKIFKELEQGEGKEDTIYIFENPIDFLGKSMDIYIYKIDNIFVGLKNKVKISSEDNIELVSKPYDKHNTISGDFTSKEFGVGNFTIKLKDGTIINDGMNEGYQLYGPYRNLEDGTYNFKINFSILEENLTQNNEAIGYMDIASNSGEKIYGKEYIYAGDSSIVLENVNLYDVEELEIRIYNYGNSKIRLQNYQIEQVENKESLHERMFNGTFNWLVFCRNAEDVTKNKVNYSMINSGLNSEHIEFGPYIELPNGIYDIILEYELLGQIDRQKKELGIFDVVAYDGQEILAEKQIDPNLNKCVISNLDINDLQHIEFRTYIYEGNVIQLNAIKVIKKN